MKVCTKCKEPKEATPENFSPEKRVKSGLQSWCRVCQKDYQEVHREDRKIHRDLCKEEKSACAKRYNATIEGYLHGLYQHMTWRCTRRECYTKKGIKNMFASPSDLVDYVVSVLQIDPRGLDCHRTDDSGHYEKGNIEFLARAGHAKVHVEMRCVI